MIRGRLHRTRIAAALVTGLLVIAAAAPAGATWGPVDSGEEANGQAELVMTGTGAGRGPLQGGLAPASFDPLTGYPPAPPSGSVPKYVDFAGLIAAKAIPSGDQLLLYCIDLLHSTSPGVQYQLGTWDESNVPNVGYVARLLNTYYPATNEPASLSSANDKASAVQAAIWFFTDKYVLNQHQSHRADVAAIVQNVIALGPIVNPPPPSISITPERAEGPITGTVGPFTLATTSPATVTATGGDLYLDEAGTIPLANPVADGTQFWARRTTPGDVDIQAVAIATVPSGNVYLALQHSKQKLILAQTGTLQTKVDATATAYDVGALEVTKIVGGAGAAFRSAVAIGVTCTDGSNGSTIYPAGAPPTPPLLIEDVRAGSTCTVIELVDGANELVSVVTTFDPGNVVVIPEDADPNDVTTVDVTNDYTVRTGSLRVTKVVTGADADERGDVVIDVSCSNGTDVSLSFPAGEQPTPQLIENLPAGTTCTTTEPEDGGDPPTVVVDTTISPDTPVTIVAGETAEVVVTNQYDSGVGSLVVQKDTEGLDELRGAITIRAECDDGSSDEVSYPPGAPLTPMVLDGLPLGTECTITEPEDGESEYVDVTTAFDPSATVTIDAPQPPVVVLVVNTYTPKPGDVTVDKTISGEAEGMHGEVVVAVACEDGQHERIVIPAGDPGPGSATLESVPAGTDCGVAELSDGSNQAVTATVTGLPDGRFVILPAQVVDLEIDNSYSWNPGSLVVNKVIDGPEAARRSAVTFTVACSNGAQQSATVAPGAAPQPIVLTDLPAFTTCRIEEPVNGEVIGVGVITVGTPQQVMIDPGGATTETITNTYVPVEVHGATTNAGSLARTGTDPRPLTLVGLVLVAVGLAASWVARRQLAGASWWTSSGGRSRMISATFGRKSR